MRKSIDKRLLDYLEAIYVVRDDDVLEHATDQINDYFSLECSQFNIPLLPIGTAFQKKVWLELSKIPFGSVSTYKKLAEKIDNVNAVRAVANANGQNALSIFIPCHRIIGTDGSLVGYAGGLRAKKKLLELESSLC